MTKFYCFNCFYFTQFWVLALIYLLALKTHIHSIKARFFKIRNCGRKINKIIIVPKKNVIENNKFKIH